MFGNKPINQITRQQIQAFHTGLKSEGKSASTCNHYIKLLRHALNLAVDWGILDKNPAARVPLFHEDNQVEHYMNADELERLLNVLRTDDQSIGVDGSLGIFPEGKPGSATCLPHTRKTQLKPP